ncbi:hypothetical protein G6F60_015487 [Rhizopus arrhizus]|nr:hypothetical protein G6F60_015487 [Rhizopus arrhizus]
MRIAPVPSASGARTSRRPLDTASNPLLPGSNADPLVESTAGAPRPSVEMPAPAASSIVRAEISTSGAASCAPARITTSLASPWKV